MSTGTAVTETTIVCNSCPDMPDFPSLAEKWKHIHEVHGIAAKEGTRKAISFMDGSGFALQSYELVIGGVQLKEHIHIHAK